MSAARWRAVHHVGPYTTWGMKQAGRMNDDVPMDDPSMTDHQRAVVLPFPTQAGGGSWKRPGGAPNAGEVPSQWLRRRIVVLDDAQVNAEWDLLITNVVEAWCWRDPSSVRVVEECLARIKRLVENDWS